MRLKLLFPLVALFFVSVFGAYASFPVEKTNAGATTTISAKKDQLSSPAAASADKSQIIALVLVLLVGGLGIHRFYLGYPVAGVIQLLTLGGCGIWSLIDLIRIVTGDLKPNGGDYKDKF
ncbi:MAG: TM2 domain-containing protein [Sphingobacteriaceae bacterium]|nr:TM2 domain-containing protein [Sphingobacteriaceae bacterium]